MVLFYFITFLNYTNVWSMSSRVDLQ